MKFQWANTVLAGQTSYWPSEILSSEEIEKRLTPLYERLKLSFGRLELMTGIKERRIASASESPSSMAITASRRLLEEEKILPSQIGLLIYCGVSRDFLEPATASLVHAELGLSSDCSFFDLSNACLGVMHGWWMAAEWLEKGMIDYALVVSAEHSRSLLDKTLSYLLEDGQNIDRSKVKKAIASLTIGSGAYASLLTSSNKAKKGIKLLGGSFKADSQANQLCHGGYSGMGMLMETDGEALMLAGLNLAQNNWKEFKESLNWTENSARHLITHQVGEAHHTELVKRLGLGHIPSTVTFPFLGNTGSVALPLTLDYALRSGKKEGPIVMLGIGSGLSSLMLGGEFQN